MALADLMKKGFLTSATATVATVATVQKTEKPFGEFATATPATVATLGQCPSTTVASVASVAVAEVKNVHSESFPQATVATVAGVAVARTGNAKTGSVATVATVAVANSKYPKPKLAEPWRDALVAEFIEVDGLSPEQAQAMAAISIQPRTPAVWLGLIAELNTLIATYCDSAQVSQEAKQRLHAVAASQSLASIPTAIEWFRAEVRALNASTLLKAQNER